MRQGAQGGFLTWEERMGLRFGLLGTGYWARQTQGAALAAHPEAGLVGVWGRDPAKAADLAEHLGARPYDDVDALITDVDAVAIALPPNVQGELALRAAGPAATYCWTNRSPWIRTWPTPWWPRSNHAVWPGGVLHQPLLRQRGRVPARRDRRRWLARRPGTLFASIFQPGNPYGASPWRREKGGLWDVGPHLLWWYCPCSGRSRRSPR